MTIDGPIQPSRRSYRSLHWIADRNPFYLLSACCGLLGCWLLGDVARQDVFDATVKIASILTYELAVVLLALWLARRDGMRRDTAILSVLAFVLAADFSFFYTQAAMLPGAAAAAFSLFGAAQAIALTGYLLRGLRAPLSKPAQWFLAVDLVVVHVLPGLFRLAAEQEDSLALTLLGVYTAIGLLVALHAWPPRWRTTQADPNATERGLPHALAAIAPVVILISAAAHVIALEWVYDIRFASVYASPLIFGIAAVFLRLATHHRTRRPFDERILTPGMIACALAGFAVYVAMGNPAGLAVGDNPLSSWLGLSPLRLALAAAAAVFYGAWRIERRNGTLILACGGLMFATLGHTSEMMWRHVVEIRRSLRDALSSSLPATRAGWGTLLFLMAFLLLGAGAWVSWWKARVMDEPQKPED